MTAFELIPPFQSFELRRSVYYNVKKGNSTFKIDGLLWISPNNETIKLFLAVRDPNKHSRLQKNTMPNNPNKSTKSINYLKKFSSHRKNSSQRAWKWYTQWMTTRERDIITTITKNYCILEGHGVWFLKKINLLLYFYRPNYKNAILTFLTS